MSDHPRLEGELFSRVYLKHPTPLRDSPRFRTRLYGYFAQFHWKDRNTFVSAVQRELGILLGSYQVAPNYYEWNVNAFFASAELRDVLDCISLIARFLLDQLRKSEAQAWIDFVKRVFHEESLGYTVDVKGGVHYLVDAEFERNLVSVLSGLGQPRFQAVLSAFEEAHRKLDREPFDTKGAVRDVFEALETLVKLVTDSNQDLTERVVRAQIKSLAQRIYQSIDPSAVSFADQLLDSFCSWVNAGHRYRHGQKTEEPTAPTFEMAVTYLSTGASWIRWLVELDLLAKGGGSGTEP